MSPSFLAVTAALLRVSVFWELYNTTSYSVLTQLSALGFLLTCGRVGHTNDQQGPAQDMKLFLHVMTQTDETRHAWSEGSNIIRGA